MSGTVMSCTTLSIIDRIIAHSPRLSRILPCVSKVSRLWLTWEPPVSLPPNSEHLVGVVARVELGVVARVELCACGSGRLHVLRIDIEALAATRRVVPSVARPVPSYKAKPEKLMQHVCFSQATRNAVLSLPNGSGASTAQQLVHTAFHEQGVGTLDEVLTNRCPLLLPLATIQSGLHYHFLSVVFVP